MSIIYTKEMTLKHQFIKELDAIVKKIELQENTKELCDSYIRKITDYINNSNNFSDEAKLTEILRSLNDISMSVVSNLELLGELKLKLYDLDKDSTDREIAIKIEQYNLFYISVFNQLDDIDMKFQKFNGLILDNYAFVVYTPKEKDLKEANSNINLNYGVVDTTHNPNIVSENALDNNVLCINEKDQKAYLPYKYENIEKMVSNKRKHKGKYKTIQDAIDNVYTVPFSIFRFPVISRFREAFNLIMKEKKDLKDAIFTGVEVMSYHDLNPIIIRACQTVQEFNIYLDCLAENETDKFDCFEIKFEVAPMIQKRKKNEEFYTDS